MIQCLFVCHQVIIFSFLFMQVFKKMRMPQIRDPSLPKLDDLPESYKSKVCITPTMKLKTLHMICP